MPNLAEKARALFEIARPKQWVKNAFVFAPLIFDKQISDIESLIRTLFAFLMFCIYSSCVYMINDIADYNHDKMHPEKCRRPLPSGRIDKTSVIILCVILFITALLISAWLSLQFLLVGLLYMITNICYSFWWKLVVIVDGMIIALGFVLRTYAGAVVIGVQFSDWLYVCAIFVSLFLAFCKRRHEIILLGEENAGQHRAILQEYSVQFLDQIITIVLTATVVSYSIYCILPATGSTEYYPLMKYTIPFVIYGLLRYLYLVYRKEEGGNPAELLLNDKPLLFNGFLWLAVVFSALYFDR